MTAGDARLNNLTAEQKRRLLHAAMASRRKTALAKKQAEAPQLAARWVIPLARRPAARCRLICFPHGGAGAAAFRGWPALLPPDIEPFAVNLPGRGERAAEPFATGLEMAVAEVVAELQPLLDRPYALYGHSLGAALAFLSTRALCDQGLLAPDALIIAAIGPPGQQTTVSRFGSIEDRYVSAAEDLDMRRLIEDPVLREQLLERARADEAFVADWSAYAANAIDTPIVALSGRDDRRLAPNAMAGWAAFTRGTFELHNLSGPHLFHLRDPTPVIEHVCRAVGSAPLRSGLGSPADLAHRTDGLKLSLFFFSAVDSSDDKDRYRLFDSAVQFADRTGFEAVWIPERHFHPVGGLFPNPSVLAAAVATSTSRIRIRSGSVVIPMHDPIRVAEEWAVVDNLSGGRVDLGVVPGWNPNDYALAPNAYQRRWAIAFEHVEAVRRLWRGEAVLRQNGAGEEILLRTHPRPLQIELPIWIATSANDESFLRAGELGANILTALLTQNLETFERRVAVYREARARAGHDPNAGRVTLMVPTCVGETETAVRAAVHEPFLAYIRSVQSLWKDTVQVIQIDSAIDQDAFEEMVFERYFHKSTLFGSVEACLDRARAFAKAGANEIACMIDFGIPHDETMATLAWLDRMQTILASTDGGGS